MKLSTGQNRLARLVAWLKPEPPPNVVQLALRVELHDQTLVLWQRERTALGPKERELAATEIDRALQDQSDELGARVEARLSWLHESGQEWIGQSFVARPQDGNHEFDGSDRSRLIQEQQHKERYAALHFESLYQSITILKESAESARALADQRDRRVLELEIQNAKLADEVAAARRRTTEVELEITRLQSVLDDAVQTSDNLASELEKKAQEQGKDAQVMQLFSTIVSSKQKGP